jgi:hypothetical protein
MAWEYTFKCLQIRGWILTFVSLHFISEYFILQEYVKTKSLLQKLLPNIFSVYAIRLYITPHLSKDKIIQFLKLSKNFRNWCRLKCVLSHLNHVFKNKHVTSLRKQTKMKTSIIFLQKVHHLSNFPLEYFQFYILFEYFYIQLLNVL